VKTVMRALCTVVAPFLALAAQEPSPLRQPDAVPFDLAAALAAAGGFSAAPQILVGAVPELASSRIHVPAGARVLGSAFIGTTVVAVLALPPSSDSVLSEYQRELTKRGWKVPVERISGGGFRSAPASTAGGATGRLLLCNDQQMLIASAARRRGLATDLIVRLSPEGTGPCYPRPEMQRMASSGGLERVVLPTLFNPVGAVDTGFGRGGCPTPRMMSPSTFTNLRVAITADALLEHYAKQLQDSGWKANASGSALLARSFTRPDSTGRPMEATITVATAPHEASCHEVTMVVTGAKQP
jgi:hypothetical protein